jgi:hypothetical protein
MAAHPVGGSMAPAAKEKLAKCHGGIESGEIW